MASALMSSGTTKSRPSSIARARASCSRSSSARGLAPSSTWGWLRVAATSATRYPSTSAGTHTCSTHARIARKLRVDDLVYRRPNGPTVETAAKHLPLVRVGEIAEPQPDREPVELRLRQRVGALILDRVVGGDHHERFRQQPGFTIDADLRLGHRLEQRGLRLRRCPVDLVGEQQVGEDRSGPELEAPRAHVVDRRAEQVGGQQIRRELHPGEVHAERGGEAPRDERLAEPGDVLDEDVPAGEDHQQNQPQRFVFADNDARELGEHGFGTGRGMLDRRGHRALAAHCDSIRSK